MDEQLTPWFRSGTKPFRAGVYEVPCNRSYLKQLFQHWNGSFWGGWANSPEAAYRNREFFSVRQSPQWRGLAKEPK